MLGTGEKTSSMGTNTARISGDDKVIQKRASPQTVQTPRNTTVQTPRKTKPKSTVMTPAQFQRRRNVLVKKYYDEFNKNVFDSKLPNCAATTTMTTIMHDVVPVTWNKRMLTSAGFTYPKLLRPSMKRVARVELATKVIDNESGDFEIPTTNFVMLLLGFSTVVVRGLKC